MATQSNKPVAVITGVGPGLGAALAHRFATSYAVAILARKADYLKSLASEIRKLQAAVPIILMSGHGGPQLAKRAAAIGVNEVLHKPLQRRDLAESLARVLGAIR